MVNFDRKSKINQIRIYGSDKGGLLVWWHDSRLGCERSRVRLPDKPQPIHYFLIDHNAPCFPPPQFCITIVFYLPSDDCNTQEKLETTVMQNFGA